MKERKVFRIKVFDEFNKPITECKGGMEKAMNLLKYLKEKFK